MRKKILILLSILGVITMFVIGAYIALKLEPTPATPEDATILSTISYTCADGKAMTATYYEGSSTPPILPDMPPTPGGKVFIMTNDGRAFNLKQTISASGIRYSDGDPFSNGAERIVFWSKGQSAGLREGDVETYATCVKDAS